MRNFLSFLFALLAAATAAAQASGSGFFVSEQGHIATSYHVVENALEITAVTMKGERLAATLVRSDKEKDLAILRVATRPAAVLAIRASAGIRRGERVYALGFPQTLIQGEEVKVTDGLVSSLSGMRDNPLMFQITNPIQPGNSGGPLITDEGQVVGVVTSTLNAARVLAVTGTLPQNVNYAMKSAYLLEMLQGLPEAKLRPAAPDPGTRKFVDVLADAEPAVVRLSVRVARGASASTSPVLRTAPTMPLPPSRPVPAGYQVVRIGHAAPLSGPQAHYGRDNDNGVRMAVDEINDHGT
ncbi:MAG TPA: trypsin-like peptidase domain-containing protein, partial [Ramlibacter sp.]|uniref:S1C family serine protease n=1 Tax=Ramlibacter sp. TaxID=1917967 RepID=UPI002ED41A5A